MSTTIYVSHSSRYDYHSLLYESLIRYERNHPDTHFFLPHKTTSIPKDSRDILLNSDLLLAKISRASTGQGIEMGWASMHNIPIIGICQEDYSYSPSIDIVAEKVIYYRGLFHAIDILPKVLAAVPARSQA